MQQYFLSTILVVWISSDKYNIQIEPNFSEMQVYAIDTTGELTSLNSTSEINNDVNRLEIGFVREEESSSIHGMVAVFNAPVEETGFLPITTFVAIFIIIAVAIGMLIYFKKHKSSGAVSGSFSHGNQASQV